MARADVLLPVHSGMPHLEAATASIRAQTEADWRLPVLRGRPGRALMDAA